MSTDETVGQATEQQPEPTDAAGCKSEVNRNVQGTGLPGFAELRARVITRKLDAEYWAEQAKLSGLVEMYGREVSRRSAFDAVLVMIDAIEADAKDETR